MSGSIKVDYREMKKLQQLLNKLKADRINAFVESCAKELAARLLAKVIKRTPVGEYYKEVEVTAKRDSKNHKKGDVYTKKVKIPGKNGGTLRRGWTASSHEEAQGGGDPAAGQVNAFLNSLSIQHNGNMLVIIIKNPVNYASYVEFGHRTRNHKGWVPGKFMLTISEQEIQSIAPMLLEQKLKQFLSGCIS